MNFILHIDINAFFASVEQIINPKLVDIPFAVGGRTSRSVVASANYIARSYGVKSGMPIFQAKKKCKELIFIPAHFDLYDEYSNRFFNLIRTKFTNIIEVFSIDECFIDITHLCKTKEEAINFAKKIQETIKQKLNLSVSIGISYNKFLAKMASDLKKPNGITSIFTNDEIQQKIWPLPITELIYLGKSSSEILYKNGFKTIKDIANPKNNEKLKKLLNKNWYSFFLHANGIDPEPINTKFRKPKSISSSRTFLTNTNNYEEITKTIYTLVTEIVNKLELYNFEGKTISLIIRYPNFKTISKSITTNKYYSNLDEINSFLLNIYDLNFANQEIRLIGAGISNLRDYTHNSEGLLSNSNSNKESKNITMKIIDDLNKKFKIDIIDLAKNKI